MTTKNENDFENNYTVVSITSSIMFSIYFIVGIFILNLLYLPQAINSQGFLGILVILAYYILTSIVLVPIIILINATLCILITKVARYIYNRNILLGFLVYPSLMSVISFLMINSITFYIGKISSFDYYYLYFNTWVCAVLQYLWILKSMTDKPEQINEKQSNFIKTLDNTDYF